MRAASWFLENDQDPHRIKGKDGENCLYMAVHFGASDKMLQWLLHHGARINQKDEQGHAPLARAQEKKHKKATAFLEAAGSKPRQGGTACLLATEIAFAV